MASVLKFPVFSEKAYAASSAGWYVFMVEMFANKISIAKEVESVYKVGVISVNIVKGKAVKNNRFSKARVAKAYKKAYIKLREGQQIDFEKVV